MIIVCTLDPLDSRILFRCIRFTTACDFQMYYFVLGPPISTVPSDACEVFDGRYMDFKAATIACSLDYDCLSIVDQGCDGDGPFQICSKLRIDGWQNIPNTCIHSPRKRGGK